MYRLIENVSSDRLAIMDDGERWFTYGELKASAEEWSARLAGPRTLVFLYASNDVATVAALMGAALAGHAVTLFDHALPAGSKSPLERLYNPGWIIDDSVGKVVRGDGRSIELHPDVSLLLSTSGSTGSPKLVRLTTEAFQANASGIADVLDIREDDVAAAYLPIHYSYGLSVLTSHLVCGARIRLTKYGPADRLFWPAMREVGVSHLPGVPFHHQVMQRLGLDRLGLKNISVLTQAGGNMDVSLRERCHAYMESVGGRFCVLYGQTEAAPRMTTLQHSDFAEAPTSVGTALPGCRLEIVNPDERGEGEVLFHGPNVMMGYAERAEDLVRGDDQCGVLATGDLGVMDAQGRLTLTGRVKRVGKIFGLRVNLDEVERTLGEIVDVAVDQIDDKIVVFHTAYPEEKSTALMQLATTRFTLPPSVYRFVALGELPRTERGKLNYDALRLLLKDQS